MGAALIESEGREIRLAVSTTLLSSRALYAPTLHSALSVSKCSQENFMMVAAAAALCCYRERETVDQHHETVNNFRATEINTVILLALYFR